MNSLAAISRFRTLIGVGHFLDYEALARRRPASARLLVVDDDDSVRESLPDLLKEFGLSARAFPFS
jgi:hypothetical protein